MIEQLRAKNFKSWRDTGELQFAPFTGFFGSNSSGKTSLLQLLLMLKQTVQSADRKRVLHTGDANSIVDLGTFYDLIHGHDAESKLGISIGWELQHPLEIADPEKKNRMLFSIDRLHYDVEIEEESGAPSVGRFEYGFDGNRFGMALEKRTKTKTEYQLVSEPYAAKRYRGRAWPLPAPVKCYGFPDEVNGYYQNVGFLGEVVLEFEGLFGQLAYLGPLREYPKPIYTWAGDEPSDVGRKGELAVSAILAARRKGAYISPGYKMRRKTMEERIAHWMREMDLIDSFNLRQIAKHRKDYELKVRATRTSPEVLITGVGFGVSQILPVLVLCYYVPPGSILLLEQPEIHLHPSVQVWLADVFIDVVQTRDVQIIVESHSEHLLRRLQRRIAEEQILSEKAALYFCSMDDSASRIECLDVDMFGNIRNWPDRFFGDEMEDLAEMTKAAMKRQMSSP